jgi:hypothetical protein
MLGVREGVRMSNGIDCTQVKLMWEYTEKLLLILKLIMKGRTV